MARPKAKVTRLLPLLGDIAFLLSLRQAQWPGARSVSAEGGTVDSPALRSETAPVNHASTCMLENPSDQAFLQGATVGIPLALVTTNRGNRGNFDTATATGDVWRSVCARLRRVAFDRRCRNVDRAGERRAADRHRNGERRRRADGAQRNVGQQPDDVPLPLAALQPGRQQLSPALGGRPDVPARPERSRAHDACPRDGVERGRLVAGTLRAERRRRLRAPLRSTTPLDPPSPAMPAWARS